MQPRAIRTELRSYREDSDVVLASSAGDEIARIDPLTYAVWQLADGRQDADAIAQTLARQFPSQIIDAETVWSAFDALRAYGLIEGWNAPPADAGRVTRRQAFRTFARTAAFAASVMPIATAAFAQKPSANNEAAAKKAQEQSSKQQKPTSQEAAAKKNQEVAAKQQQAQEKASKQKPNQSVEQAAKNLNAKPKPKP